MQDVIDLREAGFDDNTILDACLVAAYFNFVTLIAGGRGVELEDRWTEDEIL